MADIVIDGNITCAGKTVMQKPRSPLQAFTVYSVYLSDGVRDATGNVTLNPFTFVFTTGAQGDQTPPDIVETSPGPGAVNVGVNTTIGVTFSEAMLASTITATPSPFSVTTGTAAISGTILSFDGRTVLYAPAEPLSYSTTYSVIIANSVTDLAGNHPLWDNGFYSWEFTTQEASPDAVRPSVLFTSPANFADAVSVDTVVTAGFTETVLESSVTATTFLLTEKLTGAAVPGDVTADSALATFIPTVRLQYGMDYLVTLVTSTAEGGISDPAGNLLVPNAPQGYLWSFRTEAINLDLTVTKTGTGDGSVTASTGTLTWNGNTGTATYTVYGTQVTLTATAAAGSTFTGWSGEGCTGTGACTVTMTAARNIVAGFVLNSTYPLTVTKAGTGDGTVTTSTGTLTWIGNIGMATYTEFGTQVTLTATAAAGSTFTGWSGEGCAGTGACTVTMTAARNVIASFTLKTAYPLTVTKTGTGDGSVTASTGTLTWTGNTGTATYTEYGTQVTLTATAAAGSTFTGWSGEGCAGTGTCTVIMTAARNVTASFTYNSYPLTVTKTGTGSGNVTASTGTLTWTGNTGTATYTEYGTQVTLTATAAAGSTFTGWSGEGCAGTGTCTVSMTTARNVTATFTTYTRTLTVKLAGKGSGTVTTDAGTLVWKGFTGTATYNYNTIVRLTAVPSAGSIFVGWTNCDSVDQSNQCVVTMTADKTVTATIEKAPK